MKLSPKLIAAGVIASLIAGCGGNPAAPSPLGVTLSQGQVVPGTTITIDATYRVSAEKTGSDYVTNPFSSVITLPPGATYIEGSAIIAFQQPRAPDSQGVCADGRTWFLYNFNQGEFTDSFHFSEFSAVLRLNVLLDLAANGARVIVSAEETAPADPCGALSGSSAKFGVSGTPATPTPVI